MKALNPTKHKLDIKCYNFIVLVGSREEGEAACGPSRDSPPQLKHGFCPWWWTGGDKVELML